MENSQTLATESFSYSWLIIENTTPSPSSSSSSSIQRTIINLPKNKNHSFDFDVPVLRSPPSFLVHADEIFRNGRIIPVYDHDGSGVFGNNITSPRTSLSVTASPVVESHQQSGNNKWRKAHNRILRKCSGFANLLRRSMGCSNKNISSRVDDLERKVCEVRRWSYSVDRQLSPRAGGSVEASSRIKSPARLSSASCDAESSIDEAILYCKRSIGKENESICYSATVTIRGEW